ncbi:MAG TPA: hypothetical protein VFV50_07540 [Bdellovibrionales bacterium]|nr:hypothetical protein [Bdellovibrionales bacterium]
MSRAIPFEFVLEALEPLKPHTKPMFGWTGVYSGNTILFILADGARGGADRGVWVATTSEHHESLKQELPSMRSLIKFGPGPTAWQVLPADGEAFEDEVLRACELVLRGDARIGKIPKSRLAPKLRKVKRAARPTSSRAGRSPRISKKK